MKLSHRKMFRIFFLQLILKFSSHFRVHRFLIFENHKYLLVPLNLLIFRIRVQLFNVFIFHLAYQLLIQS